MLLLFSGETDVLIQWILKLVVRRNPFMLLSGLHP